MASEAHNGDAATTLAAKKYSYGGVIIDPTALPTESDHFRSLLKDSLQRWRGDGVGGVWLKLPLDKASFVPEAVEQGFGYHHAEPEYVMMTTWLKEDVPSPLPPNASHQVGVGGFVLNDAGEVLVVQERSGPLAGSGVWKMPTGMVTMGEDLDVAAPREIMEETGIEADFEALLTVRQSHGVAFGKSDLFFVCALRAKGGAKPRPCEVEISAARWAPLSEFLNSEFMRGRPLYSKILDACEAYSQGRYQGLAADKLEAGLGKPRKDLIFHGRSGAQ